jgi:hypothetical protein
LFSDEKIHQIEMIEDLKNRKNKIASKEDVNKNCFWIPEKTPENKIKQLDKPSE